MIPWLLADFQRVFCQIDMRMGRPEERSWRIVVPLVHKQKTVFSEEVVWYQHCFLANFRRKYPWLCIRLLRFTWNGRVSKNEIMVFYVIGKNIISIESFSENICFCRLIDILANFAQQVRTSWLRFAEYDRPRIFRVDIFVSESFILPLELMIQLDSFARCEGFSEGENVTLSK